MRSNSFNNHFRMLFFVIALWGFFIESFGASFPKDDNGFVLCVECSDLSEEESDDLDDFFISWERRNNIPLPCAAESAIYPCFWVVPFRSSGKDFCILYHRLKVFGSAD